MAERFFRSLHLPRTPYPQAVLLQEHLLQEVSGGNHDLLMLLEHPPTITLGQHADTRHVLTNTARLNQLGIELCEAARSGDVTYHGPGQLIGYPLFNLNALGCDLHQYLFSLEQVLLDVLALWGLAAARQPGQSGLWVDGAKIASIGIGVRRWISWHGFALNIGADLSGFSHIVPCGLPGVQMTSMERQLGTTVDPERIAQQVIDRVCEVFGHAYAGRYY